MKGWIDFRAVVGVLALLALYCLLMLAGSPAQGSEVVIRRGLFRRPAVVVGAQPIVVPGAAFVSPGAAFVSPQRVIVRRGFGFGVGGVQTFVAPQGVVAPGGCGALLIR